MDIQFDQSETSPGFTIRVSNVPANFFNDRKSTKEYFRRFGKLKLVTFRPKTRTVLIEYCNEESMHKALEQAGEYQGELFQVTKHTPSPKKKNTASPRTKKPMANDPDWTEDPEVRAEIVAMRGTFGSTRTFDLRSDAMQVDSDSSPKQAKKSTWRSSPKPRSKKPTQEHLDLLSIVKSQAHSVDDKYRILEARDKLLRLRLKTTELAKLGATVGTCPDMCPEKERLMREVQHQVALYEQNESVRGELNARRAVKQYSRSSADQEAPLPQELRPVGVLQMTMGYLMHRIMAMCDQVDVNLAEWYHFLWDRTRGIRKDITQQELCCPGAVELVEQCARFHIFCAARLVAEDPSVFDQKINTENLTKCLQTLKYMYHDLQLKGVTCPNEAEFRAYVILLNLNDGNFMWEVQQLKPEIQESYPVQFALRIHSALDKNNYVRFFKLINSTTFLNACILMRYFVQVRLSALKTLLKCYSPRISQSTLQVSYLTRILAFENDEAAVEFLQAYGLDIDTEYGRVLLNRRNFSTPEYPYVLERAMNLVETKRLFSVGEIVCGKELPEKLYESHVPQDSFDARGFLKNIDDLCDTGSSSDVRTKEVSRIEQVTQPVNLFETIPDVRSIEIETPQPAIPQARTNFIGNQQSYFTSFQERTKTPEPEPGPVLFSKNTNIFGSSSWQTTDKPITNIFGGFLQPEPMTKPPTPEPIEEEEAEEIQEEIDYEAIEKQKELERLQKERKRHEAELVARLAREAEAAAKLERLNLERRKLEEMQKRLAELEREKERIERRDAEVKDVLYRLLDRVERKVTADRLREIRSGIRRRKMRRVVGRWREIAKRKHKRRTMDFQPIWMGTRTLKEVCGELLNFDRCLDGIKRYKIGESPKMPVNLAEIRSIELLPIVEQTLVKRSFDLDRKYHPEIYFKVSISLPDRQDFPLGFSQLEQNFDALFNWKSNNDVLIERSKNNPVVTCCVEKSKVSNNESNGFIFVANTFDSCLQSRIVNTFKHYGAYVKIPVVFILQQDPSSSGFLKRNRRISEYLVLVEKFTGGNLHKLIEKSLIFLAGKLNKPPPLQLDTLRNFLSNYLTTDIWKRAKSFAKWNANYKRCLRDPQLVIRLHNEALDRLKAVILDESWREYPRFPELFREYLVSDIPDCLPCDYRYFPKFLNGRYYRTLGEILQTFYLPEMHNLALNNINELETQLLNYCKQAFKEPEKVVYKLMSVMLQDCEEDSGKINDVLWTDIIQILSNEKLSQVDFSLFPFVRGQDTIFNQLVVIYDVNLLHERVANDWFYINCDKIKSTLEILGPSSRKEKPIPVPISPKKFDVDIDEMLEKLMETPRRKNIGKLQAEVTKCRNLIDDLEDSIGVHKKILETSGRMLENMID